MNHETKKKYIRIEVNENVRYLNPRLKPFFFNWNIVDIESKPRDKNPVVKPKNKTAFNPDKPTDINSNEKTYRISEDKSHTEPVKVVFFALYLDWTWKLPYWAFRNRFKEKNKLIWRT